MKSLCAVALASLFCLPAFAQNAPVANPLTNEGSWADIKYDLVGDVALKDGTAILDVEAPERAHDAATVPVVIRQIDKSVEIKSVMIIIDENPAPLAAEFRFGQAMAPLDMEVRVRVNQYSNIRVIAADQEKGAFMNGRFVKASGGCSAPASRDPQAALSTMGQMRLKHFGEQPQMSMARREAQIMIRHPNYSGLQRDQITQLFVAAHFINKLEVYQGDDLLFTMDGGISISENPVFRFVYKDNGAPALRVKATDTEGNVFEQTLQKGA